MNMRWIVNFTVIIIIFGVFFGVVLSGLNPWTSPAEANRMNMETEHQHALNQLEERVHAAKTDAEIRELQRQQLLLDAQYQHDIQALGQDLVHRDLAFKTAMTVLTFIAGLFALTLTLASTIWMVTRSIAYVRSIPVKEEPMHSYVPVVEKRIPSVAERMPYDALDRNQILFKNRLDERLEEIAAEREDRKEAELLAARMKSLTSQSRLNSSDYGKRPLAG